MKSSHTSQRCSVLGGIQNNATLSLEEYNIRPCRYHLEKTQVTATLVRALGISLQHEVLGGLNSTTLVNYLSEVC